MFQTCKPSGGLDESDMVLDFFGNRILERLKNLLLGFHTIVPTEFSVEHLVRSFELVRTRM
jgi:hypothetical protein